MALLLLTMVSSSNGLAQDYDEPTVVTLRQDPNHPAYYYGTWYDGSYCYTVPADVEVWYAQEVSDGVIQLEKSTDNIIYNMNGVILRSTTQTVTLSKYANSGNVIKNSALSGTGNAALSPDYDHYNYYVLSYKDTYGVGFYKYAEIAIQSHKAFYRAAKGSPAAELTVLLFDFGEEATTLSEVEDIRSKKDGAYYNLQGQQVSQPTKGVYIVNGKKTVVK